MQYFTPEIHPKLTHVKGAVGFATSTVDGKMVASSSFYITLGDVESMDGKHGLFGVVAEGMDVLEKINNVFVDDSNRPFIDVRYVNLYSVKCLLILSTESHHPTKYLKNLS